MSADDPHGPAILCWDGSDNARRAIEQAARLLGDGHRAIVLFAHKSLESSTGMMPGSAGSDAPVIGLTDAEVLLERGVGVARAAGFDATGRRVEIDGKTSETIVATAEREDAPVIVMGQRGRSGLKLALLGTVSRDVINAFHRPVLMVGATSAKR